MSYSFVYVSFLQLLSIATSLADKRLLFSVHALLYPLKLALLYACLGHRTMFLVLMSNDNDGSIFILAATG